MSVRSVINCSIESLLEGAAVFTNSAPELKLLALDAIRMDSGTTAGKADRIYAAQRTLGASASENLDLAGGGLLDPIGGAVTFAKVRAILIEADSGNTNNVEFGGAASNAFLGFFKDASDVLVLAPGDRILLTSKTAGKTVTATTADIIKMLNAAGSTGVTYRIVILGTSA